MRAYILLDRSGSMAGHWLETVNALNVYASELAENQTNCKITVAAFDSGGFDLIREDEQDATWNAIHHDEIRPRGMTPLLDAIGKLDDIVKGTKTSICIMTDGAENASREITREAAKAIVEAWQAKGWDVTYIGAGFDAFGEAGSIGISQGQTINVSKGKMGETAMALGARTMAYAGGAAANASWSNEDREKLKD